MSFEIKQSTRQGIIPLLCLWGSTGSGKTESALRLARGIAGDGRVVVIDTEGKRSGYYSDRIPGGFFRLDFDAPFSPERYVEALDAAEKNADVVVLDSASHAWSGPDGVIDMHEDALDKMTKNSTDWQERERLNWPAWREPKMRFKYLTNRILSFKRPVIINFRGEEKTRMEKNDKGRNVVVTDSTTTPIFDRKFIFEAHVAMECFQKDGRGGFIRFPMPYAKTSHADIRAILPEAETTQLTVEHGAALAKWCASPGGPGVPQAQSTPKPADDERKALLRELWGVAEKVRGTEKGWTTFEAWAVKNTVAGEGDPPILAMSIEQLKFVLDSTRKVLT